MMTDHKIRRLPLIDPHDLIAVISRDDLAQNIEEKKVGELVGAVSAAS